MMEEIMERLKEPQESEDEMDITFPSDYEWRTKLYFKLLDKQKEGKMEDDTLQESSKVLHDWNIIPSKSKKVPFCAPDAARLAKKEFLIGPGPITWTVSDISKAGCLLTTPPIPTSFSDEQEMRRVYTLIYDVYRYKSILSKALEDVAFFYEHPKMKKSMSRVWLLLYDLYHRSFKKRTVRNASVAQALFAESGLQEVEEAVWSDRVKLAASVARLRIKHSALRLSQLLPYHLRDEKVSTHAKHAPVTCWVNIKKVK
ncbi:PREDICTED: putative methyltransferase NSUN7 [Nicrophorus vespilloides]|uniref:Methyltransferase NSUN7 n=1 Tax=Nicrophorus vespilloides TaxID=110193 RepID=A0ABM1NJY2_NICVS|nr:PREDICTED: putative methyltransferase NSUN7 [Nicrophorus vespilloides]